MLLDPLDSVICLAVDGILKPQKRLEAKVGQGPETVRGKRESVVYLETGVVDPEVQC